MRKAIASILVMMLLACGPRVDGPEVTADWSARRQQMLERFPASNPGADADRRAYAETLIRAHDERRIQLGRQPLSLAQRAGQVDYFTGYPLDVAQGLERVAAQRQRDALDQTAAALDGRQVTQGELVRLATTSGVPEARMRQAIEDRRRRQAEEASRRREAELVRLAGTGLADMPREILQAAGENLAESRSPFDTRHAWRPPPAELRGEEVRLRTAIQDRREAMQRQAVADAESSRQSVLVQQCQMQAAVAGAAVPTPYVGGGLGGAIAAGLLGGVQGGMVEAATLQACLQGAGL